MEARHQVYEIFSDGAEGYPSEDRHLFDHGRALFG